MNLFTFSSICGCVRFSGRNLSYLALVLVIPYSKVSVRNNIADDQAFRGTLNY